MSDALEAIIRPIVEGQIRGFGKEHPAVVEAVDWFKPRKDKLATFTGSLAKRIVRDLLCAETRVRLERALLGCTTGEREGDGPALHLGQATGGTATAQHDGLSGISTGKVVAP